MSHSSARTLVIVIVLALVVALGAQVATDALVPSAGTGTPQAVGRAGFAYLTGLRTFAAAVLWNRLDPILHDYYEGVPLSEQANIMPTIRMVTLLDPQFIDAYNISSWILAQHEDRLEDAYEVLEDGIEANPDSGLLRTSYAQAIWLNEGDMDVAIESAEFAVSQGTWRDAAEQHDSYGVLAAIFRSVGRDDMVEYLKDEQDRLDAEIEETHPDAVHDHDGDGQPDH